MEASRIEQCLLSVIKVTLLFLNIYDNLDGIMSFFKRRETWGICATFNFL